MTDWRAPSPLPTLGGGLLLAAALLAFVGFLLRTAQTPASTPMRFVDTQAFAPASPASLPKATTTGPVARLVFVGDLMQHRQQAGDDFVRSYAAVRPLIAGAGLAVANLEFPVQPGRPVGPVGHTVRFNGSPAHLDAIRGAGFDLLSLANNHVFDQGLAGLEATLQALQARGLATVGSAPAGQPVTPLPRTVNGIPMAFCAYTFRPNSYAEPNGRIDYWQRDWPVVALNFDDWTGDYRAAGRARFQRDVAAARAAGAGFVTALVHWGREWHFQPTADQRRAAHDMIDAGFDLVVGGHAHVINGPELYRGHLIAYSQGSFLSAFTDPRTRLGAVLTVSVIAHGETGRPTVTDFGYHATLVDPEGHRVLPLTGERTAEQEAAWALARRVLGDGLRPAPMPAQVSSDAGAPHSDATSADRARQ